MKDVHQRLDTLQQTLTQVANASASATPPPTGAASLPSSGGELVKLTLNKESKITMSVAELTMLRDAIASSEARGRQAMMSITTMALQVKADVEVWKQARTFLDELLEKTS